MRRVLSSFGGLLLSASSLALMPAPGRAQTGGTAHVAAAYESYLGADFAAAETEVARALADPALDAGGLARARALEAVLAGLAGEDARLARAVALAVALDRSVQAPDGASRAVRQAFETARANPARPRVAVEAVDAGPARAVRASAEDVPAPMLGEVALACTGDALAVEDSGVREARVLIGSVAARCVGTVLTPEGQRVLAASLDLPSLAEAPAAPPDDSTLFIVLGVALGVVVVGTAIGVGVAVASPSDGGLAAPTVVGW